MWVERGRLSHDDVEGRPEIDVLPPASFCVIRDENQCGISAPSNINKEVMAADVHNRTQDVAQRDLG